MREKAAVSAALLAFAAGGAFAIWRVASTFGGGYSVFFAVGIVAAVVGLIAVTQVVRRNRPAEETYVWIGLLWFSAFGLVIIGLAAGLRG